MYYTYILENSKGKLYIGQSDDLNDRLSRHNSNRVKSTKNRGPWKIFINKGFETRSEAVIYEKYLKSLKNSKYLKQNIITNPAR